MNSAPRRKAREGVGKASEPIFSSMTRHVRSSTLSGKVQKMRDVGKYSTVEVAICIVSIR